MALLYFSKGAHTLKYSLGIVAKITIFILFDYYFFMKFIYSFSLFCFFPFIQLKAEIFNDSTALYNYFSENTDTVIPQEIDSIEYRVQPVDDEFLNSIEILLDQKEKEQKVKEKINEYEDHLLKKEMSFDWWSALPLVRGFVISSTTNRFKSREQRFEYHKSDNLEYGIALTPFATSWVLKAVGVDSRSKTKRMGVANVIGLGLTCGFTQLLKHVTDETRPNGHDNHSMPSGHSALAFFSASVLDREFGHHSPWISVGGYVAALTTQFRRIHYNHHYLNDVITGAGIGTLSANIGYFITDCFFGKDGINKPKVMMTDVTNFQKYSQHPTSFSLFSGFSTGYNRISSTCYNLNNENVDVQLRTTAGYKTKFELDYFINKYLAIETSASMAQYKVQVISNSLSQHGEFYGNNIYQYHFNVGTKYSLPVNEICRVECKAFVGDRLMPAFDFRAYDNNDKLTMKKTNDFEFGFGLGIDMFSSTKYVTGFSCDFVHAVSPLMKNRWVIGSFWKILL